ncbi:hypothetical protein P5F38_09515 [Clostridium perfringens]|nr:hypothetical protein [Clostridium perfringens]
MYKFNVEKSIGVYLKIAFIICIIGLVQQLAFLFKINPIYDLSWLIDKQRIGITNLGLIRITSLMIEPAQLAMVITPAVYISFNSIYRKQYKLISKRKTFLFIICYLITFSSVAYLGFAIIFLLNIKNSKNALKKIIAFSLLFICITSLYNFVDDFKMRVDDTILAVTRGNIESKNLSTFALISNLKVSLKSIEATYGFGSGIGSHEINYYKYIDAVIDQSKVQMELNVEDANSMLLRLLSELGIFGALAVLMFIIKFNLKIKNNSINKVINDAIISLFILRLLRQGHYFNDGFFFFVILYIKNNKEYYNIKSNNL